MGQPRICTENLLDTLLYPGHSLTATSEAAGHPVTLIGSGRRSSTVFHTSTTPNTQHDLICTFDRLRVFDYLRIDRSHNLGGFTLQVAISSDGFTTSETIFSQTLPTASTPGRPTETLGVRTREGAWLKRFDPPRATQAVRLRVPPMGAGVSPLWPYTMLGLSWNPGDLDRPFFQDRTRVSIVEQPAATHWLARGLVGNAQAGQLDVRLLSYDAYLEPLLWLHGFFTWGFPASIVKDEDDAQREFLALCPPGDVGLALGERWAYGEGPIPYLEHEPLLP